MNADSERSTPTELRGQDKMNEKAWGWLSDRARQRVTALRGPQKGASRTAKSAAYILDLARRAKVDPGELADSIPEDTLRRLKYPYITTEQEDGTRTYKHDLGIIRDGRKGLLATDRGTDGATEAPTPRDESGRFIRQ